MERVTKQRVLTAVAAIFSLLIVFGSWSLTNDLLNRQHVSLMNSVNFISVQETPAATPGVEPTRVTLSAQEISIILEAWRSGQRQQYHDPYDGQLTMEEAIDVAKSGLTYLCDQGILPEEILGSDFIQTNAFLYDMQSARAVPAPAEEGSAVVTAPVPAYSFWSVSLSNRDVSVVLTLNALTGQIWMADISSSSLAVDFNSTNVLDVLDHYENYLGLSGGAGLRSDVEYALKSYDNDQIGIAVYKRLGESGNYEFLHFSLTSTLRGQF